MKIKSFLFNDGQKLEKIMRSKEKRDLDLALLVSQLVL